MLTKIKDLFKKEDKPEESVSTNGQVPDDIKTTVNPNSEVDKIKSEETNSGEEKTEEIKYETTKPEESKKERQPELQAKSKKKLNQKILILKKPDIRLKENLNILLKKLRMK